MRSECLWRDPRHEIYYVTILLLNPLAQTFCSSPLRNPCSMPWAGRVAGKERGGTNSKVGGAPCASAGGLEDFGKQPSLDATGPNDRNPCSNNKDPCRRSTHKTTPFYRVHVVSAYGHVANDAILFSQVPLMHTLATPQPPA